MQENEENKPGETSVEKSGGYRQAESKGKEKTSTEMELPRNPSQTNQEPVKRPNEIEEKKGKEGRE